MPNKFSTSLESRFRSAFKAFFWVSIFTIAIVVNACKTLSTAQPKDKRPVNEKITTASGLVYQLTKLGEGDWIRKGDEAVVHYTGTLVDGKKFDSSRDRNKPFSVKVGDGKVIKGWEEGLLLLRKGDLATFTIPPALGYGQRNLGVIPANSTLVFEMEVMEVKKKAEYVLAPTANKDTLSTASGLKYLILSKGNGLNALPNQVAKVHYAGYVLGGEKFDCSYDKGEPFSFTVGKGEVIKAWDEILPLMNKGSKYRLIAPPSLAYGKDGLRPAVKPNKTLVFDLELLDIK